MRLPALARTSHKWLGLLLAIQAVFWTAGGLYMTAVHIDIIHGDRLARSIPATPLDLSSLKEPGAVAASGAETVRLETQLGRPVYVVGGPGGSRLVDAQSGAQLSPLGEAAVRARATAHFAEQGRIVSAELLREAPGELRGRPAPLWRVQFEGAWKPSLYISPQTGELMAQRHDLWRTFDFVWMLHVMDYETRDNVNNILLRITTWMAFVSSLTGAWLLFYSFRRRRRARPAKA
ncbi:hypothetical protein [Brevundimonas sp. SL161]|uniref:hypothetical protein n=1 Tax=Brevundimonas sp. SL161 TaxID=2804613 RepID=UPI003CEBA646